MAYQSSFGVQRLIIILNQNLIFFTTFVYDWYVDFLRFLRLGKINFLSQSYTVEHPPLGKEFHLLNLNLVIRLFEISEMFYVRIDGCYGIDGV